MCILSLLRRAVSFLGIRQIENAPEEPSFEKERGLSLNKLEREIGQSGRSGEEARQDMKEQGWESWIENVKTVTLIPKATRLMLILYAK